MEPRQILHYAKGRYLNDADFHARVERALQVVRATHDDLTEDEMGLVTTAAALGLAMQWVDPQTGRIFDE